MTSDRDSTIQNLFDQARADLDGKDFTAQLMSRIDIRRRWSVLSWLGVGLVLVLCAWLVSGPMLSIVGLATSILPASLVDLDTGWIARFLAPVNSVSTVVGIGFLLLWGAYRKIFT